MRTTLLAGLPLALAFVAGCSSGSPIAPAGSATDQGSADPILSGAMLSDGTFAQSALGAVAITIDPASLTATVEPIADRAVAGQGDNFLLSLRPFLRPGNLSVTGVSHGGDNNLVLRVRLAHPFAAPADLNPPGTASKRVDLHVFDVNGILVTDGSDTFFNNTVTTNAGLLENADAYRDPGILFDKTALGVPANGANLFPYKLFANGLDTANGRNAQGNYNPSNNGWQGPDLLTPQGFDVFAQGTSVEVDYIIKAPAVGSPISFNLVVTGKYQDPRSAGQGRTKRLPTGNPLDLRYLLPEGSGDLQRIAVDVPATLRDDQSSDIASVTIDVLDWDHDATVANPWPNNADLTEVREVSAIINPVLDFPDLRAAGPFTGGAITGAAGEPVVWESIFPVANEDLFDAAPGGSEVYGLIRIEDAQDADDASPTGIKPFVLEEASTVPVAGATISSTRYQVAIITVEDLNGVSNPEAPGPTTFTFPTSVGINSPFNLDLDTAVPALATLDPDGLSLFEVDWENNGSYDESIAVTVPGADFTHTYTVANATQQYKLRITDNFTPAVGRLSTEYGPFTVNVTDTLTPVIGPEGPVNTGQSGSTLSFQADRFMRPILADATGNVYLVYRYGSTIGYSVIRSADGGSTWGTPVELTTMLSSKGASLAQLANGKIIVAGINGITPANPGPLEFARVANSGTNALTVELQANVQAAIQWRDATIHADPTDVNKAWIVSTLDTTVTGDSNDALTVWTVSNADGAASFASSGTVDPASDISTINDPNSVLDSAGILHVSWTRAEFPLVPNNGLYYRQYSTVTNMPVGAEERVSTAAQTSTGIHGHIVLDLSGIPVIAYDESGALSDIYVTKRTAGSWNAPVAIVTAANTQVLPYISRDAAGRFVVVWRDNRVTTLSADIYGRLLNADLSPATPEFAIHTLAHPVNSSHPRIAYDAAGNKHVIVWYDSTSPVPSNPLMRRMTLTY